MEIPGKVQVHFLHRNNLRVTAPCSAALHAEVRAQRGFADTDHRILPNAVQTITQTNGRGRLTLTRRRRVDRGDQHQLAVFSTLNRVDELLAHLRLVMAIGQQISRIDANLSANFLNRLLLRLARDFNVRFIAHWAKPPVEFPANRRRWAGAGQSIPLCTIPMDRDSDIFKP
ncbi:hypothetical protein RUA4292_04428 [Ruegeria atlantica]|uniref:Uncharacterized protein n=1 Tax=Ruegeria atlantica TaxID=81569 RepID=A0A0P1EIC8_9RHOB|nr:hypothetical protein RUA4292_04428 [Ruegeria atlantica]